MANLNIIKEEALCLTTVLDQRDSVWAAYLLRMAFDSGNCLNAVLRERGLNRSTWIHSAKTG